MIHIEFFSQDSPIRDLLPVYSVIQSIDNCPIRTSNDWYQCLRSIHERNPLESSGFCLSQTEIQIISSHIGR